MNSILKLYKYSSFIFLFSLFSCIENNKKSELAISEKSISLQDTLSAPAQSKTDSLSLQNEISFQKPEIENKRIKLNQYAFAEGNKTLICIENDTLIFKSYPHLEERSVNYEYISFNSNIHFHVLCAQYWESNKCYLIDYKNGEIDSLWTNPIFAPNDSSLVSKSPDYGLEGDPNGFQIWQLTKNREWVKKKEIDQQEWIPVSFTWISKETLDVSTVTLEHLKEKGWWYKNLTDFRIVSFELDKLDFKMNSVPPRTTDPTKP